ncbi:hypothetical protein C0J52_17749 [Blattella germanica]|nr:hypothetical protein C0J52_17749 [Blattella germanica]
MCSIKHPNRHCGSSSIDMNILMVIIVFMISATTAIDLQNDNSPNKKREITSEENSIEHTVQERIDQDAVPSCISKITMDYARNTAPNAYIPLNYGQFLQPASVQGHQRNHYLENTGYSSRVVPVSSNLINDHVQDKNSDSSVGPMKRSYSSMIVKIGSAGENPKANKLSVSYGNGGVALSFSGNERAVDMVLSPPPIFMSQFQPRNVVDQQVPVPVPQSAPMSRPILGLSSQASPVPLTGPVPVTTPILMLHPAIMSLSGPYGTSAPVQISQPVAVSVPQPHHKPPRNIFPAGEGVTQPWYNEASTFMTPQQTYSGQIYQAISEHSSIGRDTYNTAIGTNHIRSEMPESYLQLIMGSKPPHLGYNFNALGHGNSVKTNNR